MVSLVDDGAISSSTTASSMTMTSSQVTSGGVVWKMSEESSSWTMFPSVGLLYPGEKSEWRFLYFLLCHTCLVAALACCCHLKYTLRD